MGKTLIQIPEGLIDIAPGYLENRIRDLYSLKDALARKDFEFIAKLSHKTKGTAGGYGFEELSLIAKELENAAKSENLPELNSAFERMRRHLESIQITE